MMHWRNSPSDVGPRSIEALYAELSIADVLLLEATTHPPIIVVPEAVREAVYAHLRQSEDELGGLLIGEAFVRAREAPEAIAVVRVLEALPSEKCSSTGVSLRMEADVWTKARERLDAGDGRLVVGWYHSHPRIGAFFSATDRATQRAFFPHGYSIGWVIDPYTGTGDERFFLSGEARELPAAAIRRIDGNALA